MDSREWYCNLNPNEISSFCYFLIVFQEFWIDVEDQMEGLNDAFFFGLKFVKTRQGGGMI
jgi:hypothetical protein